MEKLLYKNVDICDLGSILQEGLLPADRLGHGNWQEGRRAGNATDVVYLFSPAIPDASFPEYGAALLACNAAGAEASRIPEGDVHMGEI